MTEGYVGWREIVTPGLTYRNLDYWTRCGYLRVADLAPGSGRRRYWSTGEARVAAMMGRLVAAGVTVAAAHRAARNDGWLAEGVRVVVSSDQDDHSG